MLNHRKQQKAGMRAPAAAHLEDEGVGEAGDGEDALHAVQVLPPHLDQAAQPVVHLRRRKLTSNQARQEALRITPRLPALRFCSGTRGLLIWLSSSLPSKRETVWKTMQNAAADRTPHIAAPHDDTHIAVSTKACWRWESLTSGWILQVANHLHAAIRHLTCCQADGRPPSKMRPSAIAVILYPEQ